MSFGTTPKDTNSIPLGSVYVPNHSGSNLSALQGGPASTDANGNESAPAMMYLNDGNSVTYGAQADVPATSDTGTFSFMALLKRQLQKLTSMVTALQGILNIQQTDLGTTGTISAAQPSLSGSVAGAAVALTLGYGQSAWEAQLLVGTGGFTSGTTIVADVSIDGGVTWFASSFKINGSLTTTTVQSVTGPGPLMISGIAAAKSGVRMRCSVLNGTETVNVTIRSAAGIANVGLFSSLPIGTNTIGNAITIDGIGGVNKQTVNSTNQALVLEGNSAAILTKQPAVGTAGIASANVLTVQGIASMTPIAISGTVSATNPSVSIDGATVPLSSTQIGASDGTNLQPLQVDASKYLKVNIAAATTVPVSGTFWQTTQSVSLATAPTTPVTGTFWQTTQPVSAVALPLPTGAALELGGNLAAIVTALASVLAIKRSAVSVYALASTAEIASGTSADLTVGPYTEIAIDVNITAGSGTGPTIQFFWDRKGADSVYYPVWQSVLVSSFGSTVLLSTSIGAGMAYNQSPGSTGRLRWVLGGASSSITFSANVVGK